MKVEKIQDVIVVGAGQAGLAISYYLKNHRIKHIVLEQHFIGYSWKEHRWDSFKMNTPNWMTTLPGMDSPINKREYFMTKEEFVMYLKKYVRTFNLPILENHKVIGIEKTDIGFAVNIEKEGVFYTFLSKAVVIASGIMNKISLPKLWKNVPAHVKQFHASEYKNVKQMPTGNILVVGGGQSGCQIAEELALAKRKVYLAGSKVARAPRRYKGKDIMEWMDRMGMMDMSSKLLKEKSHLLAVQPQVSGLGLLGHTVSYQSLYSIGVTILDGLKGVDDENLYFDDNAKSNIHYADETSVFIKSQVDAYLEKHSAFISEEEEDLSDCPDNNYVSASDLRILCLRDFDIATIIWATGFGYDFSYLNASLVDDKGRPEHVDGEMLTEGFYCIGFPWLRKKKSGLVFGVSDDAKAIVEKIMQNLNKNQ